MTIRELIKEHFELVVQKQWLKDIEKVSDRCTKAYQQYQHHYKVLGLMLEEYKKIYGEDLRKKK